MLYFAYKYLHLYEHLTETSILSYMSIIYILHCPIHLHEMGHLNVFKLCPIFVNAASTIKSNGIN